jgi:hypothetical protein
VGKAPTASFSYIVPKNGMVIYNGRAKSRRENKKEIYKEITKCLSNLPCLLLDLV